MYTGAYLCLFIFSLPVSLVSQAVLFFGNLICIYLLTYSSGNTVWTSIIPCCVIQFCSCCCKKRKLIPSTARSDTSMCCFWFIVFFHSCQSVPTDRTETLCRQEQLKGDSFSLVSCVRNNHSRRQNTAWMVFIFKFLCGVTPPCQEMMPANVLIGRGSPLLMYLLSPASLSSPKLNLDLMVFWTQYPGSRHGQISMLCTSL